MVNIFGKDVIRGKEGPRGPAGIDGSVGPIGPPGPTGVKGEKGDTGQPGQVGLTGPRGVRGYKGDPGKDGIDLMSVWMTNTLLKNIRENEENGCFFIRNLKDIICDGKKINQWITRSLNGKNLIANRPSENLIKLPDDQGYAIGFNNSLYIIHTELWMDIMPGYGFFCVTFKTQGVKEQVLFSNYDSANPTHPPNELLVSKSKILICGVKSEKSANFSIDHDCREWTTLFVEWNINQNREKTSCRYIINNDIKLTGYFSFDTYWIHADFIAIGIRKDGSLLSFNGGMRAIEFYFSSHALDDQYLPTSLRDKIIESQCVESDVATLRNHYIADNEGVQEPTCKIMKIE